MSRRHEYDPADHPGAVYLHGLNVWAVRVGSRATAVKAASAKGWTAFRWLGDWFVSDRKPDEKGARELVGRMVPKGNPPPPKLRRAGPATFNAAFWKWFGKSRVVDSEGRPLVVYHGTTKERKFSRFMAPYGGIYFTSIPEEAAAYAAGFERRKRRGVVYQVYLRIENPWMPDSTDDLIDFDAPLLRSQGYDGVVGSYPTDWGEATYYAAFSPSQIKSATANRGTWDPKDPDIRRNPPSPRLRRVNPYPNLSRADDAIGVVPDQQKIEYMGFTVKMKPSQFLSLSPQRTHEPSPYLSDAVRYGSPIGPPFLEVRWVEETKRWQVYGHEGRGRAIAILRHFGDAPIEVDVLPQYMRARDLTPEMRRAPFVKDVRENQHRPRTRSR